MERNKLTAIEKVIFLKSVDIFSHATIEDLGRVAALTEEIHFPAGETIFSRGESTDAIFFIIAGRVAVQGNGGEPRVLTVKQAFGTVAALDRKPAVHTVKAVEAVHALKLNAQDFEDILAVDFDLTRVVIHALCQMIRAAE